jgi:hypothetical protein
MDPALIPPTGPGRQLAWLMNLEAEPSVEEIEDHLEPTAAGEVNVDLPKWATENPRPGLGLLAFGTMVRELPGAMTRSEDALLCLELEHGAQVLVGVISINGAAARSGCSACGSIPLRTRPSRTASGGSMTAWPGAISNSALKPTTGVAPGPGWARCPASA